MRRAARLTLVATVLALWAMAGPLAVVFADCPEMGAMCEGLCGIQACVLAPDDAARAQPSGVVAAVTLPRIALFVPSGLEPPPKLVLPA
jgi:hypothetical protein